MRRFDLTIYDEGIAETVDGDLVLYTDALALSTRLDAATALLEDAKEIFEAADDNLYFDDMALAIRHFLAAGDSK